MWTLVLTTASMTTGMPLARASASGRRRRPGLRLSRLAVRRQLGQQPRQTELFEYADSRGRLWMGKLYGTVELLRLRESSAVRGSGQVSGSTAQ